MERAGALVLITKARDQYESAWDALQAEGERTEWRYYQNDEADTDGQGLGWFFGLRAGVEKLTSEATDAEIMAWLQGEIKQFTIVIEARQPFMYRLDTEANEEQGKAIGQRDALQNVLDLLTGATQVIQEEVLEWMEALTEQWQALSATHKNISALSAN